MPTRDPVPVRVYYKSAQQRDAIVAALREVNPDEVAVYNGTVDGLALPETLDRLQASGLAVLAHSETAGLSLVPVARGKPGPAGKPGPEGGSGPEDKPGRESKPARAGADVGADATGLPPAQPTLLGASSSAETRATRSALFDQRLRSATASPDKVQQLLRSGEAFLAAKAKTKSGQGPSLLSTGATPAPNAAAGAEVYEVTFKRLPRQQWRGDLKEVGGEICSYGAANMCRVFLTPDGAQRVRALPYVLDVAHYGVEQTVTSGIMDMVPADRPAAPPAAAPDRPALQTQFDLLLHRPGDAAAVRDFIIANDGTILDQAADTIRFSAAPDLGLVGAIAARPEVSKLAVYHPKSLLSDRARELVGIDAVNVDANRKPKDVYTGKNQVVAIFDSGIDATHPDLADRIQETASFRGAPVDDTVGHGTHVAGIIAGTGAASDRKIRGCAPDAKLVVVAMVDADGRLLIPPDVRDLLKEAVDRKANIINLSWGDKFHSAYEFGSFHLDKFVYEHEDVLVVVAAGNAGAVEDGRYVFSSIGTPATSKNAITVGACGTDRPIDVRWSDPPWSVLAPPGDFKMCTADSVAVLSSRGPTDYESVKPDVCACGVYVASARAANARMKYWQPDFDSHNGKYAYLGGTSMAAPVVSGAAAVVRQYLQDVHKRAAPTAALLKAVLVASARKLKPITAEAGDPFAAGVGYPNFHGGYGRVDISTVLPGPHAAPGRRLLCEDVPNNSDRALHAQAPVGSAFAAARTYRVKVVAGATEPLRVVLAWTDVPGKFLHNNLQLYVQTAERVHVGNSDFTYHRDAFAADALARGGDAPDVKFGNIPFDRFNNTEAVFVERPTAGEYRIFVLAQYTDPDLPAQGFGLCACGEFEGETLEEV